MDFGTNNWLCLTDNLRPTGQMIWWRWILRAMICFIFLVCLFSFCLVWFVFFLLSCPVWVESACKGCNKICFSPSQWWFYDREENQKRKCFSLWLFYLILLFPANTASAIAIYGLSLMKSVVDCEGKFLYFHTETFCFYVSVNTSTMKKKM